MSSTVLVVGLGEVGRPLLELVAEHYDAVGIDVEPVPRPNRCDIMHICFPFEIGDFQAQTARYIEVYRPALTIINSTVPPGTTRAIGQATQAPIVHSPVRGKHARMKQELLHYVKYIGGLDALSSERAAQHLQSLGMKTRILESPEATELAKLAETTYFALLVAWAQEVERCCDRLGVCYDEVTSIFEEVDYLPRVRYFPGVIGGHCLLPNIKLLKTVHNSQILDAIEYSNELKRHRATG